MTQYLVYDVFTDTVFGGNQLAVFPDARELPENKLQAIAAEFNFSEVTFVYPPVNPDHSAKVRIFTPTSEVDFAGHPVIGTVIALSDLGYEAPMVLELGVGPMPCDIENGFASFTTSVPLCSPRSIIFPRTLPLAAPQRRLPRCSRKSKTRPFRWSFIKAKTWEGPRLSAQKHSQSP